MTKRELIKQYMNQQNKK